jgi:predicted NAD-dependent protein-ADP-ribosyltransferase YbiA (DUF1768 family)
MSTKIKTFSFLNRWFIFRRRSTGSGTSPRVVARSAIAVEEATDAAVEEAAEGAAEETAEEAVEEAPAEETAAEEAEEVLPIADGPILKFFHQSAAKDELKIGDKNWRRYISTFTHFPFKDTVNPSIVYPSMEAALGAAKYALASNKPELGAQIFSVTGNIHQKYESQKKSADAVDEEGVSMRDAQKPAAYRKTATTFNQEAWDAIKERVIADLVRQRYEGDAHFREILNAAAKLRARLMYYTQGGATDLSGTEKGDAIQGDNLLGRAYMKQVGYSLNV